MDFSAPGLFVILGLAPATNFIQSVVRNFKMNNLQILALLPFSLIHLLFLSQLIIELSNNDSDSFFGFIVWGIGIITAISNILFAEKVVKGWILVVFSICAILWIFPPLLFTFFGIPMALIFLILGVIIHYKGIKMRKI